MRRASLAALCAALTLATAHAEELSVSAAGGQLARIGMVARAERIVHHGESYLLVRLTVQNTRMVDRPDGTTDTIRVGEGGRMRYLPVVIACDAVTMETGGRRERKHALSLCSEPAKIAVPFETPAFLVFRYPAPGSATIRIPVTVLPPGTPVQTRRDAVAPAEPARAPAYDALIGERVLAVQVLVPDARR
jgi:hypothetical protein